MQSASDQTKQVNMLAIEAKRDEAKLETLIRQNTGFILGVAGKSTGRYVTKSDDEWSVALIAFHEAVRSYAPEKGDFLGFAALVIRRRLIDQSNREAHAGNEVPVDFSGIGRDQDWEEAPPVELEIQRRTNEQAMHRDAERTAMRDEIEALTQVLSGYDISFADLERCSPKARKTKAACAGAVRAVLGDPALVRSLRKTKSLPVSAIRKIVDIPLNILSKHRKYIIAAIEILHGDFPGLAEYLHEIRKGGDDA